MATSWLDFVAVHPDPPKNNTLLALAAAETIRVRTNSGSKLCVQQEAGLITASLI